MEGKVGKHKIRKRFLILSLGQYSSHLHGKFVKAFQKLAETYGMQAIVVACLIIIFLDQTVQKKKELSKLESKWLVRAARYANKEQYDKEYQALYMMICYFAQKKNSLADKVHKANLEWARCQTFSNR